MRRQCPECRTLTGGKAAFCGSCGFQFTTADDKVRQMAAAKPKKNYGASVIAGLAIAVAQYMLRR